MTSNQVILPPNRASPNARVLVTLIHEFSNLRIKRFDPITYTLIVHKFMTRSFRVARISGVCRKFLALTARRAWRSTLPSVVGGGRDAVRPGAPVAQEATK